MHFSRQYLQQLAATDRKALRKAAEVEAKETGSNKTRKVDSINYTSKRRGEKRYELGS